MEPPFLSWCVLVIIALVWAICASTAESQSQNGENSVSLPPPPPPPPFSPPPPPWRLSPPPPPHKPHHRNSNRARKRRRWRPPPPPPPHEKLNAGKKVGLLFAGVAAILQICAVGFLVFKRRQLFLKTKDQNCSAN